MQEKNVSLLKNSKTDPVAGPRAPKPHLRSRASSFSPWGSAEVIEGPEITVEPGPLRALLRH